MNDVTCIVCNYPQHYAHFPLQDFEQMIIPVCDRCLASAKPDPHWGSTVDEALGKAREFMRDYPSPHDFTKR